MSSSRPYPYVYTKKKECYPHPFAFFRGVSEVVDVQALVAATAISAVIGNHAPLTFTAVVGVVSGGSYGLHESYTQCVNNREKEREKETASWSLKK